MNPRGVWDVLVGNEDDTKPRSFRHLRHNFFFHLRPAALPAYAIRHTLCLGGLTIFLFIIEGITGALLMFYYVPSTAEAYQTTMALSTTIP
jgi:quinol-cytochrome oxidoreductase complex cytochrome b subunit